MPFSRQLAFGISMESQPQNSEFRNNPEDFHYADTKYGHKHSFDSNCIGEHCKLRGKCQNFQNPECSMPQNGNNVTEAIIICRIQYIYGKSASKS